MSSQASYAVMRILFGILLAVISAVAVPAQQYDSQAEAEMVRLVNNARAKANLPALQVNERLTQAARAHSELLAQKHALSHQFPGEPILQRRLAATGLRFNSSGENVAYNSGDANAAHEGLMHSPPHRANILDSGFNSIGIGVVRKGDLIYVTEDFAHRLPEVSVDEAEFEIRSAFQDLRKKSGVPPLPYKRQSSLRQLACQLAQNDRLETDLARELPNVKTVVVWTATEPADLPSNLRKLGNSKASGWSLGSCFASSPSYPNPVWWNVAVTYF